MNFFKKHGYDIFKVFLNQLGLAFLGLIMTMATYRNSKLYFGTSVVCVIIFVYLLYTMFYEMGREDKPSIDGKRSVLQPLKGFWISLWGSSVNILCGIMVAVFSFFVLMQSPVTVTDSQGNAVMVYTRTEVYTSADSVDTAETETEYMYHEASLYSDNGGDVSTEEYEGGIYSEVISKDGAVVYLYDEDGNEIELYSDSGMSICTSQKGVRNWASNLYGIPYTIATFLQSMFAGIRDRFFAGNDDFFYLLTPILPIAFSSIGYYFGAMGKRIFFFLPEPKRKPPKTR